MYRLYEKYGSTPIFRVAGQKNSRRVLDKYHQYILCIHKFGGCGNAVSDDNLLVED